QSHPLIYNCFIVNKKKINQKINPSIYNLSHVVHGMRHFPRHDDNRWVPRGLVLQFHHHLIPSVIFFVLKLKLINVDSKSYLINLLIVCKTIESDPIPITITITITWDPLFLFISVLYIDQPLAAGPDLLPQAPTQGQFLPADRGLGRDLSMNLITFSNITRFNRGKNDM
ncbi:unnamed protein product, partial [Linum tenue]